MKALGCVCVFVGVCLVVFIGHHYSLVVFTSRLYWSSLLVIFTGHLHL